MSFTVCRNGRAVAAVVEARHPDLAVLDLQIGSMGGMAVTMGLRLDESSGRLPHVPVLMLLDRQADVHLAKRCGADGWLVKPLDPLTIKRAVDERSSPTSPPLARRTASAVDGVPGSSTDGEPEAVDESPEERTPRARAGSRIAGSLRGVAQLG